VTYSRNLSDEALTDAVLASFDGAPSERFREIARALVRHLHAFVADAAITEEEWLQGIGFLTRTGHITNDKRQEFILLSDVLGVSMLVIGLNNRKPAGAT
jgi:hydroxyquinol 1,2-dioxygenase